MDFGLNFDKIQQIIDARSIANPSVNLIVNSVANPAANPIAVSIASFKAKDDTWLIRENTLYSDKSHNRYTPCSDVQRKSTACVDMTADRTHRLDAHFHLKDFPDNNPLWTQGNRHRRHSVDVNTEDGNLPSIFKPLESPAKAAGSEIARILLNVEDMPIDSFYFRYVTQIPLFRGNECLQTNSAALSDKSFDIIPLVSHGSEGWFDDEIIDMSFDMLSRILDLPSQRIALTSVAEATDLFNIGHWVAASAQNPDFISSYTQNPQIFNTEMIKAFSNKDWLVLPVNDGYPMGIINNPDSRARHSTLDKLDYEPGESLGSHWSLMIVDIRPNEKSRVPGYYFDSMYNRQDKRCRNQNIAVRILQALQRMLNENNATGKPVFNNKLMIRVDPRTPHQRNQEHNLAANKDAGACGSFTWLMAKECTQYLLRYKQAYNAWPFDLNLPESFADELIWDSQTTPETIKGLVERGIRTRRYLNGGVRIWFESGRGKGDG